MISEDPVPPVGADETLTRYVFFDDHIRQSGVNYRAFLPPKPNFDLSVNRLRDCDDDEIWGIGNLVGAESGRQLRGRADFKVAECPIPVVADPIEGNPNHAIIQFPSAKQDQIRIAQEIVANAVALRIPG